MSYANAIRGIPQGSTWIESDGTRARVIAAAGGWVTFRSKGFIRPLLADLPQVAAEREFRARFAPRYNREQMGKQFRMTIANLGIFTAYWIGDPDRFVARSQSCTRPFRIPDGAREIGVYANPCTASTFFADLDDALDLIDRESATATRPSAPGA